jgi:hypothetical protein
MTASRPESVRQYILTVIRPVLARVSYDVQGPLNRLIHYKVCLFANTGK